MKNKSLKHGKVLLAEPFMIDPNFKRAVVLLCEHEDDGTLGFILNKSLDMKINELITDFPEFNSNVYYGGPVQTDTIHYIHNLGPVLDDSHKVVNGVFWGGDFEKLKVLIDSKKVKPDNIRFFVGYSGWSPGQLIEEVEFGSWVAADMHANYLFKSTPDTLWKKIMRNKGSTFSVIAQLPEGLTWN